jgi:histidinol-phosphate aminotransferase
MPNTNPITHKTWNTRARAIVPYTPGEQPRDRKFIKLNTNENPYPPPPPVLAALKSAVNDDLRLYPDPTCRAVREAIAAHYGVTTEQVFVGNGSDEILALAFGAFFESGPDAKRVLFPDTTYSFYPVFASLWDVPFTVEPLKFDWSVSPDDYLVECGGVVLANPNAPTGIATPVRDVLTIADFQAMNNKVVIVDEAYADFAEESVTRYINDNLADHSNILIIRTLSKSASLAGLRVGFALGDAELIEALCRLRDSFNSYTVDRIAQAGAVAVFQCADYYRKAAAKVIATRERISATLLDHKYIVLPSNANFIFVQHPTLSGGEFFQRLRDTGVLVRHFTQEKIADFVRVTIGADSDMDAFLAACALITAAGKPSAEQAPSA